MQSNLREVEPMNKAIARKLVAVRIDQRLHRTALSLSRSERSAGRKLSLADVYEAALRAHLGDLVK